MSEVKSFWVLKRTKAIKQLVCALDNPEDQDGALLHAAIEAMVFAHIAVKLECSQLPPNDWGQTAGCALDLLLETLQSYDEDDPDGEDALENALDALAVAHSAIALVEWNGPLKW